MRPMLSTMMDRALQISTLLTHGARVYARSQVITVEPGGTRRASYAEVAGRAAQLAHALTRLGVKAGDRVGTFAWNCQEHLECYLGIPSMGAVLHTLNIRLFPEQLAFVINHAADRFIIVHESLIPLLARVAQQLTTVEAFIVIGAGDASALGGKVLRYDELLAAESAEYAWPEVDERSAAAMCYTSGTTGNPKGVVYSHRSTVLHSFAAGMGSFSALTERDRVLLIVPMFHANAWGLPYAGWMTGTDFVMPTALLQAEPMVKMIQAERPTFAGAVPSVWNDVLHYCEGKTVDLSSLRMVVCGGSAVPRRLMELFEERHGVRIIQAWGMTETSPLGAVAHPPVSAGAAEQMDYRSKTGRVFPFVELRIVDDAGKELPWDGTAVGEIECRGPWITASYHDDPTPEKFHDGWLRTGDVGSVDAQGFVQITDRAKDVIKSGGEWISSVDLENLLMGHPKLKEACVIAVPHPKWDERPLAVCVKKDGSDVTEQEIKDWIATKVAKWWIPDAVVFVDAIPRTSAGKFLKRELREKFKDHAWG